MARRRAEWAGLVGRWRRSGLTAREFAESIGVRPATLSHWAWRVGRERRAGRPTGAQLLKASAGPVRFVEVVAGAVGEVERFELELANGRRLRIAPGFEAEALERLLRVVEGDR